MAPVLARPTTTQAGNPQLLAEVSSAHLSRMSFLAAVSACQVFLPPSAIMPLNCSSSGVPGPRVLAPEVSRHSPICFITHSVSLSLPSALPQLPLALSLAFLLFLLFFRLRLVPFPVNSLKELIVRVLLITSGHSSRLSSLETRRYSTAELGVPRGSSVVEGSTGTQKRGTGGTESEDGCCGPGRGRSRGCFKGTGSQAGLASSGEAVLSSAILAPIRLPRIRRYGCILRLRRPGS